MRAADAGPWEASRPFDHTIETWNGRWSMRYERWSLFRTFSRASTMRRAVTLVTLSVYLAAVSGVAALPPRLVENKAFSTIKTYYAAKMPPRLKNFAKLYGGAYVKATGEVVNTTILLTVLLLALEYRHTGDMDVENTVKAVLTSEEVWSGVYMAKWTAGKVHLVDKMIIASGMNSSLVKLMLSIKSNIICLAAAEMGAGMAHEAFRGVKPDGSDADVPYLLAQMKKRNFEPVHKVIANLLKMLNVTKKESRKLLARIFRDRVANLDFVAMMVGFGAGMVAGAKAGAFIGVKVGAVLGHPEVGIAVGGTIGGAIGAVMFGAAVSALTQNLVASIRMARLKRLRERILEKAREDASSLCDVPVDRLPPVAGDDEKPSARSRLDRERAISECFVRDLQKYLYIREKIVAVRAFLFQKYGHKGKRGKMRLQLEKMKELYTLDLEMWDELIALSSKAGYDNLTAWLISFENDSVIQDLTISGVLEIMGREYEAGHGAEAGAAAAEEEAPAGGAEEDPFVDIMLAP